MNKKILYLIVVILIYNNLIDKKKIKGFNILKWVEYWFNDNKPKLIEKQAKENEKQIMKGTNLIIKYYDIIYLKNMYNKT